MSFPAVINPQEVFIADVLTFLRGLTTNLPVSRIVEGDTSLIGDAQWSNGVGAIMVHNGPFDATPAATGWVSEARFAIVVQVSHPNIATTGRTKFRALSAVVKNNLLNPQTLLGDGRSQKRVAWGGEPPAVIAGNAGGAGSDLWISVWITQRYRAVAA